MTGLLDRLGRRGVLTITVENGAFDVYLVVRHGSRTTDVADLFEHCHLGASDWFGNGPDLAVLLGTCEEESRPRTRDIDELVWSVERRRETRTLGPPLPTFMSWRGWSPGMGRWLRTFSHKYEYLGGYLRDLKTEREHEARWLDTARRRAEQTATELRSCWADLAAEDSS